MAPYDYHSKTTTFDILELDKEVDYVLLLA